MALLISPAGAADASAGNDPIPADQVDTALQIIAEIMPGTANRLEKLRENDPKQFHQLLRRVFNQRIGAMVRLKQQDPELFEYDFAERKLESQAYILSRRIKQTDAPDVDPLNDQLRKMLYELFDARLRTREFELTRLEIRLQSLRGQLEQQRQQKQALIDKRYDELLAKAPVNPYPPDPRPAGARPKDDPKTLARPRDDKPITKPLDESSSPGGSGGSALNDEQIDQILAVIAAHRPELAQELRALREHDPEQFSLAMSQHAPRLRKLMLKRRQDPKGFDLKTREQQLHAEAVQLARKVGGKEIYEAQTVREKLRMVLEQQFDARQDLLQHELTKLEKRIDQAHADLESQRAKKDNFVNHRFDNLTRPDKK
ncbi:hypothetical protein HED60_11610 [Planctomycetales bacterium ZRK34]|nr:hypothetical protein HED60_11610 [Planctomycetales bacterium ZRK34]